MPSGGDLNSRMETSASAGFFSDASSLVSTCISMSGYSAEKSLSRGMKYSLAKNGLEALDLMADGGRRDEQFIGRYPETLVAGRYAECAQPA